MEQINGAITINVKKRVKSVIYVKYNMFYLIFLLAFLLITIALLIAVSINCYLIKN